MSEIRRLEPIELSEGPFEDRPLLTDEQTELQDPNASAPTTESQPDNDINQRCPRSIHVPHDNETRSDGQLTVSPVRSHSTERTTSEEAAPRVDSANEVLPSQQNAIDQTDVSSAFRTEGLKPFTIYDKLGKLVLFFIFAGNVVILGVLGFWAFLWHAGDSNATWYRIMAGDHLKIIVTITAETVNRFLGYMAGAECSMIVALALERAEVFFPSLASAATGRGTGGGGKSIGLMRRLFQRKWPRNGWRIGLPVLVVLVGLIDNLSFGTHTALLTDINLGQLPARHAPLNVAFGFRYQSPTIVDQLGGYSGVLYRSPSWDRKAAFYPAFAEYKEDSVVQNGTSDTGVTLRAFLPFSDPTQRKNLHEYVGRTTVLDARVTCQLPVFSNLSIGLQDFLLITSGFVTASQHTSRLGNYSLVPDRFGSGYVRGAAVPFVCVVPLQNSTTMGLPDQWRTSLCQLGSQGIGSPTIAGGLVSEFKNYTLWQQNKQSQNQSYDFGTAYLLFNVSAGVEFVWQELLGVYDKVPIPVRGGRPVQEWLQFSLQYGLGFSSTLCFSAFDTADLPVKITTDTDRNVTEPEPKFNSGTLRYSFGEILKQYGFLDSTDTPKSSPEERGVFRLENQSWIAPPYLQPPVEPYLREFVNLAGPNADGTDANWSGFLFDSDDFSGTLNWTWYNYHLGVGDPSYLAPDPMHIWLFQEIMQNGGSAAFAVQSLITLLVSMAYYDQLGQFNNIASVSQSFFIVTNLPTRWWGWLTVNIYLLLHLVVSWIILCWFATATNYTMLGESWQGLAQAVTHETLPILVESATLKDDVVKKDLMDKSTLRRRVRLGPSKDGDGKIGIFMVDTTENLT